jgi:hypothetical protein
VRGTGEGDRPDGEEGDIVGGVALHHGAQNPLAERLEVLAAVRGHGREALETLVDRDATPLHQPVGVEQEGRARDQPEACLRGKSRIVAPQRGAEPPVEKRSLASRPHHQRWRMPRVGGLDHPESSSSTR